MLSLRNSLVPFLLGAASLSTALTVNVTVPNGVVQIRRPNQNVTDANALLEFNENNMNVTFNFDDANDPQVLGICTIDVQVLQDCPLSADPNKVAFNGLEGICTNQMFVHQRTDNSTGFALTIPGEFKLCVYGGENDTSSGTKFTEKDPRAESNTFKAEYVTDPEPENNGSVHHHTVGGAIAATILAGFVALSL